MALGTPFPHLKSAGATRLRRRVTVTGKGATGCWRALSAPRLPAAALTAVVTTLFGERRKRTFHEGCLNFRGDTPEQSAADRGRRALPRPTENSSQRTWSCWRHRDVCSNHLHGHGGFGHMGSQHLVITSRHTSPCKQTQLRVGQACSLPEIKCRILSSRGGDTGIRHHVLLQGGRGSQSTEHIFRAVTQGSPDARRVGARRKPGRRLAGAGKSAWGFVGCTSPPEAGGLSEG